MQERRGNYWFLVGRPEVRRPLQKTQHRWDDNNKMDLQKEGWGGMDWIDLAHERDRWRGLVNAVINFRFPDKAGISWLAKKRLASQKGLSSMESSRTWRQVLPHFNPENGCTSDFRKVVIFYTTNRLLVSGDSAITVTVEEPQISLSFDRLRCIHEQQPSNTECPTVECVTDEHIVVFHFGCKQVD